MNQVEIEVKISPNSDVVVVSLEDDRDASNHLALAQRMSREEFRFFEEKLRRKVDLRLMLMAWIMYVLNYFDRSALAAAKILDMPEDLGMNPNQYRNAMMLLFVGYISMQVPSNMYLVKGRPSMYLPACMAAWGVISALAGLVRNAAGLYAVRVFLGFMEAPFCAGCLFLISSWYTRAEMGFRSALLLSAPMFAHGFSPIIAGAIAENIDGALGIEDWRWLFIIGGTATVTVAIFAAFILPDFPFNTRWLSKKERAVAERRLIVDAGQVDVDNRSWKDGFITTVRDSRVYGFAFMYFFLAVGSSLHNFFPSVVETLGFNQVTTLWLSAPPYAFGIFVVVLNSWYADRVGNDSSFIIGSAAMGMIGFLLFLLLETATTTGRWSRYAATFLMISGVHAANPIVLAWTQKTLVRPRMKRACTVALVNATSSLAQIITSYLYPRQWAPKFIQSMALNAACALAAILLAMAMHFYLQRAKKKLEKEIDPVT